MTDSRPAAPAAVRAGRRCSTVRCAGSWSTPSCRWRCWPLRCSRAAGATAAAADDSDGWQRAAAAVLGVLVAVTAGSHVVRAVFRLTRREYRLVRAGRPAPEPALIDGTGGIDRRRPAARRSSGAGGARLGAQGRRVDRLPRARRRRGAPCWPAFPEGLALVLAVKGVGRYSELRDSGRAGGARVGRAGGVHHRHAGEHALGRRRGRHGDAAPLTSAYRDPAVPLLRCPSCAS